MKKRLIALILLMLFALASCASAASPLEGRWLASIAGGATQQYVFSRGGEGVHIGPAGAELPMTWTADEYYIEVTFRGSSQPLVYRFYIDGDHLSLQREGWPTPLSLMRME